jgi:hypothetical protein
MPGLRFAIGAVMAVALLIVAVFGLAATVQVAHHRSVTPDDPWRTLAFPDPTDWGLLADRSRPASVAKTEPPEVPQARVTVTASDPETVGAVKTSEREAPQETDAVEAVEQPTLAPAPATIPAVPLTSNDATMAAPQHERVDVVAAIPETKAAPIQRAEMPPAIEVPAGDGEPLEPSERVGTLPGFPTAGHGFVPPEHPIALPVPLPSAKPAVKKPQKKKVARSRPRPAPSSPPLANTGYPLFGFDRLGPDNKTGSDKTTGYDRKWAVE